jgi:cell division transport system ATP-binding protein
MITFNGVSKIYSTSSVGLKDINLNIEAGEFVSIVGQSGVGKTTLVRLLIAEERPTAGKVEIGGWDISKIKRGDIPYLRRQIGVIFQDFKLLPKKTVFENIAFALEVAGTRSDRIAQVVPQVIDIVGLSDKASRYPDQLSGGEQQRIVIARALINDPPILLADEPTGNLDPEVAQGIMKIFLEINKSGTTILMATHNHGFLTSYPARVLKCEKGKIIEG